MKSMREKYFENFEKVQTPADNRRGFKTEYRYKGMWYRWDLDAPGLKKQKALFLVTEAVSVILFLAAALRFAELNTVRLAAGFAVVSIIAWIAEIWGVVRFVAAKDLMMVSDFEEIKNCITVGSVVRVVLLVTSMIVGMFFILRNGQMSWANAFVCAGHLLSAGASLFVLRWYTSLRYDMYKSENK